MIITYPERSNVPYNLTLYSANSISKLSSTLSISTTIILTHFKLDFVSWYYWFIYPIVYHQFPNFTVFLKLSTSFLSPSPSGTSFPAPLQLPPPCLSWPPCSAFLFSLISIIRFALPSLAIFLRNLFGSCLTWSSYCFLWHPTCCPFSCVCFSQLFLLSSPFLADLCLNESLVVHNHDPEKD